MLDTCTRDRTTARVGTGRSDWREIEPLKPMLATPVTGRIATQDGLQLLSLWEAASR